MKNIFILLAYLFVGVAFSQKVEVKKDLVSVDGKPVFELRANHLQTFTLYNLNQEKLGVFNVEDYYDSREISNGNPKGRVAYFDVTFMNSDMDKCEIPINGFKKSLAKYIVQYELVKDNQLNETAVKQFVRIHGMKFSEQKERSTTIIIHTR